MSKADNSRIAARAKRPNYFIETVKRFMQQNEVQQVDIVRHTGITESHLSHILRGKQNRVDPEHAGKIAQVIGRNDRQRAEVIQAYLQDQMPETKPAKLVAITIRDQESNSKDDAPAAGYRCALAPDVQEALDRIQRAIPTNSDLREMILRLAKYAE